MTNAAGPTKLSPRTASAIISILILVAAYWLITLFFVFPANYLSVKGYYASKYFDLLFFQRWGFFAPPPTYNERLYYSFYKSDMHPTGTYEVLQNIYLEKQQKAPFNKKEEVIDYILSNSISTLIDYSNETRQVMTYESYGHKKKDLDSIQLKHLIISMERRPEFKTLLNYGRLLAIKNGFYDSSILVQIKVARMNIPQFEDRSQKGEEELIFASTIQKL